MKILVSGRNSIQDKITKCASGLSKMHVLLDFKQILTILCYRYPKMSATEFFTPGDANVSNSKCSPFPQAVFRVYKNGEVAEELYIGGSLVVRADTRNFDGDTNPDRYVNKVKNLFYRHVSSVIIKKSQESCFGGADQ